MSLNDVLPTDTAARIAGLQPGDVAAIIKAASVGLSAKAIHAGATEISRGGHYDLPSLLGSPRPIRINIWSFIHDHGQYADTYGLTDARAGELKALLRTDRDAAVKEVTDVVTGVLRRRGSPRPVIVTLDGMPGAPSTDHSAAAPKGDEGRFTAEITRQSGLYGMYQFEAVDSGLRGPYQFKVPLGGDLYAAYRNKKQAVNVARICRVKGRFDDLVVGHVVHWPEGGAPVSGDNIPDDVTFDGRLKPGEVYDPKAKGKASE
nr:hypothetical protein [Trichoderma barbatum polymycovirus 1]